MHSTARLCVGMLIAVSIVGGVCADAIIVDHTCTDISAIPDSALPGAIATKLVLRRASVGGNIDEGLNDLYDSNHKYDRSNWDFSDRGNPGWAEKITDIVDFTADHVNDYDVFSMKFCFIDQDADWPTYRDAMEQLESDYPTKTFVWWTMPIMTEDASSADDAALRHAFNVNVRNWCAAHDKILFDIADIECYNPSGVRQTDGSGSDVMWPAYSSDGGHLSDAGRLRIAKAFWNMMTRIGAEVEIRDMAVTAVDWTQDPLLLQVASVLRVTVANQGNVAETAARVKVLVNGVQIGATQTVSLLPGHSTVVEFPWTPGLAGPTSIVGRAEPTVVPDVDRANNSMTKSVVVRGHDIQVSRMNSFPASPVPGQPAKLYVYVRNVGAMAETAVRVKAFIDGTQVGATFTTPLAIGQEIRVAFDWTPPADGVYTFDGRGEPTVGPDTNRANNSMRKTIKAWRRDVAITGLSVVPSQPIAGHAATLKMAVANKTDYRESAAVVKFYVAGTMVGSTTVDLAAQQSKTVQLPWTFATAGTACIEGRIEPTSGTDTYRPDNYRRIYAVIRP